MLVDRIRASPTPADLLALWQSDVDALLTGDGRIFESGARTAGPGPVDELRKLVGDDDATMLLTGVRGAGHGLARLQRGEIDRADYARTWGHRCPDEFEVSTPRPAEDPARIDRLLAGFGDRDPDMLIKHQQAARDAWRRLAQTGEVAYSSVAGSRRK